MPSPITSYVAIGDSFTEGVGDDLPDGSVRGWADLVAQGLAQAAGAPIRYANLSIRGRKLRPIIGEQLEAAIALRPDAISINGGGNDLLRPRVTIAWVSGELERAVERIREAGIHPIVVSGANPSGVMPAGAFMQRRGDALAETVAAWTGRLSDATMVDNWSDRGLMAPGLWSEDRLHLNARGHAHAATNALRALGVEAPESWADLAPATTAIGRRTSGYYRQYVVPWVGRRITGRSSGDGRDPKHAALIEVAPV